MKSDAQNVIQNLLEEVNMFGYVVINKPELKFKEFDIYKGYYCGLCHSLKKRHGIAGQITLTYDMTFLALLLTSLYAPEIKEEHHRCISHPLSRHQMFSSAYTDYVADMNVILAYYKSLDDWKDDHNVVKLAFSSLLKHKCKLYKEKSLAISDLLNQLQEYEKADETNIDLVAGTFGKIMSIVCTPHDDEWAPSLQRLGFFLGKFIYILDAYKDIEKDIKKNSYNPFKSICNEPDFNDRIEQMLNMMMAECSKEFEYLPIIDNVNILRNILYAGVWTKYYE